MTYEVPDLTAEEELLAISYQATALIGVIEGIQKKLRQLEERAQELQQRIDSQANEEELLH